MGPSEKRASKLACEERRDTFSSPVCEQDSRNCGHFERSCRDWSQVSLRSGVRGGEGGIRTSGAGLNGARGDVRVSYRDSIFYPETEGRMALRLCAQPLRFPVQSKGEWLAILWLKVVSTTPLKRPNWFARDCAPLVQSKSKKYLRTMCSSKGERRSSKSMAPWCVVSRPFMYATPTENVEKFSGLRRAGCAICGWRETRCS